MNSKTLDLAMVQFAPRKGELKANLAALAEGFDTSVIDAMIAR